MSTFKLHTRRRAVAYLTLATLLPSLALAQSGTGPLYINELVADNETGAVDEEGKFEDWIELYNGSSAAVSLSGYTLSDDPERPDKWPFPAEASIPAGGYLIVWADEDQEDGPLHANFKLARTGETVSLFSANGTEVDAVTFPELTDDQAYARQTDGGTPFVIKAPTFAADNGGSSSVSEAGPYADLRLWPTAAAAGAPRTAYLPEGVRELRVVSLSGQELYLVERADQTSSGRLELRLPELAAGAYLLVASGDEGARSLRLTVL